jgi:hypothetical protein
MASHFLEASHAGHWLAARVGVNSPFCAGVLLLYRLIWCCPAVIFAVAAHLRKFLCISFAAGLTYAMSDVIVTNELKRRTVLIHSIIFFLLFQRPGSRPERHCHFLIFLAGV